MIFFCSFVFFDRKTIRNRIHFHLNTYLELVFIFVQITCEIPPNRTSARCYRGLTSCPRIRNNTLWRLKPRTKVLKSCPSIYKAKIKIKKKIEKKRMRWGKTGGRNEKAQEPRWFPTNCLLRCNLSMFPPSSCDSDDVTRRENRKEWLLSSSLFSLAIFTLKNKRKSVSGIFAHLLFYL